MFKKFASIAMAAALTVGTAAFSVNAAEVDDAAVAADDNSSAVGAEQESDSTGAGKVINFDVNSAGWGSAVKIVYCHIYSYSNDGQKYSEWQTKAEKCDYDASTGIATYDLQTGIDRGATGLSTIDSSNKWVVMFSSNTGAETYTLMFNSSCFGDTVIADPNTKLENNEDSEKSSIKISYKKNSSLTAPKCITSTGKVQGESFAEGVTNETLLGDYYFKYAVDDKKVNKDQIKKISDTLGIKPSAALSYAIDKINKDDGTNYANDEAKTKAIDALKKVVDEIEGSGAAEKASSNSGSSSNGGSGSNGSSNSNGSGSSGSGSSGSGSSGSGSSGSGSSGSGSGSVSSGQETTIFFVFGGVVVAAAGVMFLARKKRQF